MSNQFKDALRKELETKGWTQSELARRCGLRRDAVNTYIHGFALPNAENMAKIAKAFKVSVDVFDKCDPFVASGDRNTRRAYIRREALPEPQIQVEQSADGSIFLRINKSVSLEQATQILGILKDN
jgi:transcriptional regulator with XRE-family HTH domain